MWVVAGIAVIAGMGNIMVPCFCLGRMKVLQSRSDFKTFTIIIFTSEVSLVAKITQILRQSIGTAFNHLCNDLLLKVTYKTKSSIV